MPAEPKKDEPTFAEERMSNADLAARLRDVENQLAAARAAVPTNLIPEHAGGDGSEIAQTWSQAEQEEATAVAHGWPGHPSTQQSAPPPSGRP